MRKPQPCANQSRGGALVGIVRALGLVHAPRERASARPPILMDLASLQRKHPGAVAFKFGDSEALCRRLTALVRCGKKTATCGALSAYEAEGEPLPRVGRTDIALHWDGSPALLIRTTEVTRRRFCDVDEPFALAEGENDSLEGWRADHQAFFERNGGFSPEMVLVCERFELVEAIP